jgi:acyl-CoA thioesterase-2
VSDPVVAPESDVTEAVERLVGVEAIGDDRFIAYPELRGGGGGLFGGQMIALTVRAAGCTVDPARIPYSVFADLLRPGSSADPIELQVDRTRDGTSVDHRRVRGTQGDKLIVDAVVVCSQRATTIDWQRFDPDISMGDVPDPSTVPEPEGASRFGHGAFDVRHLGDAGSIHPLWVRSLGELPDDPWLQASVVAFWSDFGLNWSTREVISRFETRPSVSLNHALWFHRVTRADEWHFFTVQPRSVVGRQGLAYASILSPTGAMVASVAQGVFVGGA